MSRLIHAIRDLSPSCREVVPLQSGMMERVLPLVQRIGMRIHVLFCVWCRRYGKQVGFLRVAFRRFDRDRFKVPLQVLSPQARERIKRALAAAQK